MSFNFTAAVAVCSDFGAQENKICHCFHFFPFNLPWSNGTGCHRLVLFFLSWISSQFFTLPDSPTSRHCLVPLHFFVIRVFSFACLRRLIFFQAILILACDSSKPAFHRMYSAKSWAWLSRDTHVYLLHLGPEATATQHWSGVCIL